MAVLQVGKDGKAPAGAKVGDTIRTAGGDYKITGGSAGSWTSEKVSSGGSGGSSSSSNIPYNIGSAKGQQIADNLSAGQTYQASDGSTWVKNRDGSVSVTTKNGTYTPNAYQSQVPVMQQVPTPQAAYTDPTLMGKSIGELYGLTYDYGTILKLLNDATKASYASQQQEFGATENQFYRNMIGSQEDTLNMLRQNQAKAVATGASKGIAAANELSAILNLQDTAAVGASDLATQRNLLVGKEQAAYEQNAAAAMDTSNSLKTAIAGLDLSKYGYDVQQVIGKLDYLANQYSADKTLEGVKYNADQNLAGTVATQKFNAASNNYYGGYQGGGNTPYLKDNTGKPATTPTGGKVVDGASMSLDAWRDSDEEAYAPSGANTIYYKQPNGLYTAVVTGQTPVNDLSWSDVQKVAKNRHDPAAVEAGYGESEFNKLLNVINGGSNTIQTGPKTKLEAELGNSSGTTPNKSNAGANLTTGTKLTYMAGTHKLTYTYNAAKGHWENADGWISVAEMNKRLAAGTLKQVTITKP